MCGLYSEGLTTSQISEYLLEQYDVTIHARTIERRFRQWQITKRVTTPVSEQAKLRIQALFFEVGLEDSDILIVLEDEGFKISR